MTIYEKLFPKAMRQYERLRGRKTDIFSTEYEQQQWLSSVEIEKLSIEKFQNLCKIIEKEVPFFRDLKAKRGRAANLPSDFGLLSKSDYQAMGADALNGSMSQNNIKKATGGSTGQPFKFEYNRESEERRQAVMWRGYGWAGAHPGTNTAYLWASPLAGRTKFGKLKESLFHYAYNRSYYDVFGVDDDKRTQFARLLNNQQPKVIVAYVSAITEFAEWLQLNKVAIHTPHSIITGAEPLGKDDRILLEATFGCQVFNTYGSREFMLIASECSAHQGLHVNADHLLVEVVNEQGAPVQGELGQIVITDLHNHRMPLVRYQTGDLGILSANTCGCGRGLPLLDSIQGRILDLIYTRLQTIPGEFFPHTIKDIDGISAYQVRQTVKGEAEVLVVGDFDSAALKLALETPWGGELAVEIVKVADIPLTASGKRRVTVSNL